jgi:hypothetical protein
MNGVWACRECIERGGGKPVSGPEYVDLGYCGAGGHKAAGLWWFPDGLATMVPPPGVEMVAPVLRYEDAANPTPPRSGRAVTVEKAGQMSFLDQL